MNIELNEEQTIALVQMLLFEVSVQKSTIEMQESFNKKAGRAVLEKSEEIQKLKTELKALKPVEPVKRGPGRPKKAAV